MYPLPKMDELERGTVVVIPFPLSIGNIFRLVLFYSCLFCQYFSIRIMYSFANCSSNKKSCFPPFSLWGIFQFQKIFLVFRILSYCLQTTQFNSDNILPLSSLLRFQYSEQQLCGILICFKRNPSIIRVIGIHHNINKNLCSFYCLQTIFSYISFLIRLKPKRISFCKPQETFLISYGISSPSFTSNTKFTISCDFLDVREKL